MLEGGRLDQWTSASPDPELCEGFFTLTQRFLFCISSSVPVRHVLHPAVDGQSEMLPQGKVMFLYLGVASS